MSMALIQIRGKCLECENVIVFHYDAHVEIEEEDVIEVTCPVCGEVGIEVIDV